MITGSWTIDWFIILGLVQLVLPTVVYFKREAAGVGGIGED
ncbi:hypothetical protein [Parendozoicomonas callyspongiae]|nr:hypothetical protein [Sansalvadorimonas sp. 2012CJ34-2]